MSDSYQLWRVEAPRHSDLMFVLFHWHIEGGRCSPSVFKDVGTVMTLSEGYYTNQMILREACHAYHCLHLTCLMCTFTVGSPKVLGQKENLQYTLNLLCCFISVIDLFLFSFGFPAHIGCSNQNPLLVLFFIYLLWQLNFDSSPKVSV